MDVAKAIALGADGVVIGTAEMVAHGLRAVRQLRERSRLSARHRHDRQGAGAAERDTGPGAEAHQPLPSPGSCSGRSCCIRFEMNDIRRAQGPDRPAPIRWHSREDAAMNHANEVTRDREGSCSRTPFKYMPAGGRGRMRRRRPGRLESGRRDRTSCRRCSRCTTAATARAAASPPSALCPEQLGVDRKTLEQDYLVQVAYLKDDVREELEKEFIHAAVRRPPSQPRRQPATTPCCWRGWRYVLRRWYRYFCRAKKEVLDRFMLENALNDVDRGTGRGRVRLSDQLQDQPEVLRRRGRCPRSSCPTAGTCSS